MFSEHLTPCGINDTVGQPPGSQKGSDTMADSLEEQVSSKENQGAAADAAPPPAAPAGRTGVEGNDAKCVANYANFCRVTGTPEELIVDFGLNKQVGPDVADPIEISQRLIVNFFTAKRLMAALHMAVQRHEAAFGVLETDVQKRVMPRARRGGTN
jgi:hypothetical protein